MMKGAEIEQRLNSSNSESGGRWHPTAAAAQRVKELFGES